jgi:hypothetical protein
MTKIYVVQKVTLFGWKNMTRDDYTEFTDTEVSLHFTEHGALINAYNKTIDRSDDESDDEDFPKKLDYSASKDMPIEEIRLKHKLVVDKIISSHKYLKYYQSYYKVYDVEVSD